MMRAASAAFCLASALALTSCQSTKVDPQAVGARPSSSTDEAGLWMVMDREEAKLKDSPMVVRSPELNAYVRSVLCRVTGPYCVDLRLYIVEQPYFNANVAPNGAVQVWTGLLLRADNEAQLAFVLGHEFSHYVHRDSLRQFRSGEDTTGGALIFAAATAPFGGGLLAALVANTAMYDYSRDIEREADASGFDAMRQAGYAPSQCSEIWRQLSEEVAHSDIEDVRRSEARASIFKTHPLTSERMATLTKMAEKEPAQGDFGEEAYQKAMAPFIARWMKDDVRRTDYGESLFLIDRMIATKQNLGVLYFERGEALRLRRHSGDAELALSAYQEAATHLDAPAVTWREWGEVALRLGRSSEARTAFQHYIDKNPNAEDRPMIETTLSRL